MHGEIERETESQTGEREGGGEERTCVLFLVQKISENMAGSGCNEP